MFERYNEQARRAMFYARFVAGQSGSTMIQAEHLLLGLVREAGPMLARLAPAVTAEELRERIPRNLVVENPSLRIQTPLSTECKTILGYSAEEANDLQHRYIGAEHLLLGILRESTCLAARVLSDLGIQLELLRQTLARGGEESRESSAGPPSIETDRDTVHALIDRLPDAMLPQVRELVDHLLSRTERQQPRRDVEGLVVKGTFPANPVKSPETATEPDEVRRESAP